MTEALKKKEDVQQLNCTDPDGDRLRWGISSGNIKRFFQVTQTGMLMTKKRMDAEGKANPYLVSLDEVVKFWCILMAFPFSCQIYRHA